MINVADLSHYIIGGLGLIILIVSVWGGYLLWKSTKAKKEAILIANKGKTSIAERIHHEVVGEKENPVSNTVKPVSSPSGIDLNGGIDPSMISFDIDGDPNNGELFKGKSHVNSSEGGGLR